MRGNEVGAESPADPVALLGAGSPFGDHAGHHSAVKDVQDPFAVVVDGAALETHVVQKGNELENVYVIGIGPTVGLNVFPFPDYCWVGVLLACTLKDFPCAKAYIRPSVVGMAHQHVQVILLTPDLDGSKHREEVFHRRFAHRWLGQTCG